MNLSRAIVNRKEFDEIVDKVFKNRKYWWKNKGLGQKTESWIEKFKEWLQSLFEGEVSSGKGEISRFFSMIIVMIVGIALAIALFLLGRYIFRAIKGRSKLREILGEEITKETTPETFRSKAMQCEKEGEYRLGIRYYYIALLFQMHENRILYLRNAMTNTEIYKSLVANKYPECQCFQSIMETFNEAWYGKHIESEAIYEVYKKNIDRLWNGVMSHEKK